MHPFLEFQTNLCIHLPVRAWLKSPTPYLLDLPLQLVYTQALWLCGWCCFFSFPRYTYIFMCLFMSCVWLCFSLNVYCALAGGMITSFVNWNNSAYCHRSYSKLNMEWVNMLLILLFYCETLRFCCLSKLYPITFPYCFLSVHGSLAKTREGELLNTRFSLQSDYLCFRLLLVIHLDSYILIL